MILEGDLLLNKPQERSMPDILLNTSWKKKSAELCISHTGKKNV